MSERISKVAVVGLGRMGAAIARNIIKAGFDVAVYNRTAGKMGPLVAAGARPSASPREAAIGRDAVVTCLFDDASVFDVIHGEDGLLAGLPRNAIHVGTTTVSPRAASRLAEMHADHGSQYVAGPVVGRPDVAGAGQLLTLVGGDAEAISHAETLIKTYAPVIMNVGQRHSVANSAKLAVNFMVSVLIELIGEVRVFADKSGLDPNISLTLVSSMLGPQALKDYAKRIFDRSFDEVGFDLLSGIKDGHLIMEAAEEVRAPLSLGAVLGEKYIAAVANGLGGKDWSAVTEVTRMSAGLQ
jgi:3-hydroxyisobutyrate dehydrogenase-like beta-hydroxyacid dehydrogenase